MKRIIICFAFILSLLMISGCGSSNIMNDYSFGHQIFKGDKSKIEMFMPFEIGQTRGLPWLKENQGQGSQDNQVTYAGSDKRINIIVIAEPPTDPIKGFQPVTELGVNAINNVKANPAVSNVIGQMTPVLIDGLQGVKVEMTYVEKSGRLGLVQYLFIDRGILWNIIYQYKSDDPESVALIKYVEGKIKIEK